MKLALVMLASLVGCVRDPVMAWRLAVAQLPGVLGVAAVAVLLTRPMSQRVLSLGLIALLGIIIALPREFSGSVPFLAFGVLAIHLLDRSAFSPTERFPGCMWRRAASLALSAALPWVLTVAIAPWLSGSLNLSPIPDPHTLARITLVAVPSYLIAAQGTLWVKRLAGSRENLLRWLPLLCLLPLLLDSTGWVSERYGVRNLSRVGVGLMLMISLPALAGALLTAARPVPEDEGS
ncbi:MAG: hypothetical protein AB1758_26840 [Candidatus Eremiobacterota bacterium]